jgi:hypothetical protein
MRRRRHAAAAWLVLAAASVAGAWNTETEDDALGWRAVYVGNDHASSLPLAGFSKNEHTELSHIALAELGVGGCFGIAPSQGGGCSTTVVDLNAALFRPALLGQAPVGDDPETAIEERLVPPPAHFSGLPDYSYAVHDWINKNSLCPALPDDAPFRGACNKFAGWMGFLNANHFGTQARHTFSRYHRIALALAARARALRELLEEQPPADTAYADYVREAEIEALVFEGVGQHFLSDRWSTGHMWERWNAADYAGGAGLQVSALVAATSGLLHGSQGVTSLPDAMCSPRLFSSPLGTTALPVNWRLGGFAPAGGVGDYRLADAYDGFFGVEFGLGDLAINVAAQRAQMLACLKAGWAEVIRAFGEVEPGRYGAHRVALAGDTFHPVLDDPRCWDVWATNEAIAAGWVEHPGLLDIDKQARGLTVLKSAVIGEIRASTAGLVGVSWRIATAQIFADPDGVTLARGDVGSVLDAQTGDAYAFTAGGKPTVAEYVEPLALDALPDRSPTYNHAEGRIPGMDKQALFGFFNRAHADHWCGEIAGTLLGLRGSQGAVVEEACTHLANRVYRGTDPSYLGRRRESRRVGDTPLAPICALYGVQTPGVDPDLPYHLHPGYVAVPGRRGTLGYDSIAAWCRRVPVLDIAPCGAGPTGEDSDEWDVVARVGESGGIVLLNGRDFGEEGGEVRVRAGETATMSMPLEVVSWSDTQIEVSIGDGQLAEGAWFLEVRPAGDVRRRSVGRFILRVGAAPCLPGSIPGFWILRRVDEPTTRIGSFFLEDGSVMLGFVGRPAWVKVGTWSVAGNTIRVQRCAEPNFDSFELAGSWTPDAEADNFGVRSCPPRVEGPCPAIRGTFTYYFSDGTALPPWEVDSAGGFSSAQEYDEIYPEGWMDCHGGCGQYWSTALGPTPCAPL